MGNLFNVTIPAKKMYVISIYFIYLIPIHVNLYKCIQYKYYITKTYFIINYALCRVSFPREYLKAHADL